jgi:hypothetical protein
VMNAAGDLYILSFLGPTGSTINPDQQVLILPAASPTTPYILPNTNLGLATGGGFDPNGNLDVSDFANGAVVQLSSPNPVNLGSIINVGQTGSPVQFNFEYNAPVTLRGFQIVTQGDVSTEVIQSNGGTCTNGRHTNLGVGGPAISPYFPYTCTESFYGNPRYPGVRSSAIQVKGPTASILASTPVYQTGFAGVEVTYPLDQSITASGLQQPQAVAISGLNNTVYVSDSQSGKVYSTQNLGGSALTPVSTGSITLTTPLGLALDGAGNLFIADYDGAQIVEVPTTTGAAPSVVKTGGLLQHPLAVAFDYVGNLYIGDAGRDQRERRRTRLYRESTGRRCSFQNDHPCECAGHLPSGSGDGSLYHRPADRRCRRPVGRRWSNHSALSKRDRWFGDHPGCYQPVRARV